MDYQFRTLWHYFLSKRFYVYVFLFHFLFLLSLRRIKFESTIQRSTQLTHGVLYFFLIAKKLSFACSLSASKNTNYSKRDGIGQNSMIIHQYSIIAEARKSSGRRCDVFTHGNLGGGLKSMRVALFFASKQPARPWIRLRFSELLGQQTSNGLILIGQITRLNVRPTPELRSVSCNEVDDHLTPFARDSNLSFDSRLSIVFRLV